MSKVAIVHCVTLANWSPCIKGRQRYPAIPTLSSHYQMGSKDRNLTMADDKLKKSLEDEIHFLKGRVLELESDLVSKSTKVTSAVSGKKEALSSAFTEIDRLKEENSVKT
ncbi:uncharacterized protein LOC131231668 isoform X2 [Magnolia sinica]|uniref:uncharacterized protein LOC131231668 isoform X2 n=1 Tax=Magnolia sinica TaxID=86752 RepID=UPI00265A9690|nr:uncharacterized protein LOC131231668 isoform X2 [Magnolia sinica]